MKITRPLDGAVSVRFMERVCLGGLIGGFVSVLLAGCGGREHATPYAAAVFDDPPIYCYRTIGDVDCFHRPLFGAERRLVNYYGPPPDDYERPEPPPAPLLHPPPPGRAVPGSRVAPALVPMPTPAAAPGSQPTPLFPADSSAAAGAAAGEGAATVTSSVTPTATVAGTEKTASAASGGKPVMAAPKPRPHAATDAAPPPNTAPLVIEVEDR